MIILIAILLSCTSNKLNHKIKVLNNTNDQTNDNEKLKLILRNVENYEVLDKNLKEYDPEKKLDILMQIASRKGDSRLVKFLIDLGYNINSRDKEGNTVLMISLLNRKVEISDLLLDNNANIFPLNNIKMDALKIAMSKSLNGDLSMLNLACKISHIKCSIKHTKSK